jgi:3-deoxy-D-manno-octulosonic-acid transferase
VTGPHLHNFAEIARRMEEAGAVRICADADAVGDALVALLADHDARMRMSEAGQALVAEGRGALQRTLELIRPVLPPPE